MVNGNGNARRGLGRNLTYGLVDTLGRAIVNHAYDTRPFPIEAELAREHSVSRSVTREAVKMLTAKGLLSARPRQGTIVEPVRSWNLFDPDVLGWLLDRRSSSELLREFNQLRIAIEPEAAALAALNARADDLSRIAQGLERMRAAERGDDDPLDSDIEFHVAVLEASNNAFFAQFRDVVSAALRTSIKVTNKIVGHTANIEDHDAVFQAITQRHPEQARTSMRSLIADVLELINDRK